jgi:hypothetical protein|tara:strand:- start:24 stop:362 length:339 start_codon:yes stop_codon:yes gene_type:complete
MLTEDQLKEIVFDLGAARKGQLDENILHVFAAWIEYLLSKMYKGRRIPVKVRGNRIEVQRFTDALVNEKRYMDYIKKYGLDDPMTYKQKSKLNVAIKRFEREAQINWPIKNP